MTNEVKDELLAQTDIDELVEDFIFFFGNYSENLDEVDCGAVLDAIYEKADLTDLYYKCFQSVFKRKDRIQKYIELQKEAQKAVAEFTQALNRLAVPEINKFLPEEERFPETVTH